MDTTPINATPAPSRRIYKFPVVAGGLLSHHVQPVHVGFDADGVLCCWGQIDFDEVPAGFDLNAPPPESSSTFLVVPTGADAPIKDHNVRPSHLGTVVDTKTRLVWHVLLGPTDEALAAFHARQAAHKEQMGQINDMLMEYAQRQRGTRDAAPTEA